MGKLFWWPRSP